MLGLSPGITLLTETYL